MVLQSHPEFYGWQLAFRPKRDIAVPPYPTGTGLFEGLYGPG